MALSKNTQIAFEIGDLAELPVLTNVKIYEGALGGIDAGTGYARPLTAGDAAVGFAESPADNTGGASGAIRARFREHGKAVLAIANLAITDIDKPVYASDDGTFTLTATGNSFVGVVDRFVSTGVGLIAFDFRRGRAITALTDNTAGTANDTLEAVTDLATAGGNTYSDAAVNAKLVMIRNNFADLAAKVNTILKNMK